MDLGNRFRINYLSALKAKCDENQRKSDQKTKKDILRRFKTFFRDIDQFFFSIFHHKLGLNSKKRAITRFDSLSSIAYSIS
jgi:hypothetical protein